MQNKINFIIEKCGGNSLAHVLKAICFEDRSGIEIHFTDGAFWKQRRFSEVWDNIGSWQLLKDNQEAKLQDQTPETIDALYQLLSGE